jgi:hypothetical protein
MVALWVRSYFATDCLQLTRPGSYSGAYSATGKVCLWYDKAEQANRWALESWSESSTSDDVSSLWRVRRFAGVRLATNTKRPETDLAIPFAYLVGLTAVAPAWWARRRLRSRRLPGCCGKCGYNLRATPDRCSECGAVPEV